MLPEKLEVEVRDSDLPCAGALVHVTLVATRKNHFESIWGPTDAEGRLTISRRELLNEGLKDGEIFVMDYGHPEKNFGGQIRLRIAKREEIRRGLEVYSRFAPHVRYRVGYEAMLRGGLSAWEDGRLRSPELSASAGDAQVVLLIEK